jgi:hypothetical protein
VEPFTVDKRFVASRELLLRARGRVTAADVRRYVPHDPGVWGYIAAYEDILERGEAALIREKCRCFSLTETISLTQWVRAPAEREPLRFRWFRILTCGALHQSDDARPALSKLGVRGERQQQGRPDQGGCDAARPARAWCRSDREKPD